MVNDECGCAADQGPLPPDRARPTSTPSRTCWRAGSRRSRALLGRRACERLAAPRRAGRRAALRLPARTRRPPGRRHPADLRQPIDRAGRPRHCAATCRAGMSSPRSACHAAMLSIYALQATGPRPSSTSRRPQHLGHHRGAGLHPLHRRPVHRRARAAPRRGGRADPSARRRRSRRTAAPALPERQLLADHAAIGCLSLVGSRRRTGRTPSCFLPFRSAGAGLPLVPAMQLVYLPRHRRLRALRGPARPLCCRRGRALRRSMMPTAPIRGLPGFFRTGIGPANISGARTRRASATSPIPNSRFSGRERARAAASGRSLSTFRRRLAGRAGSRHRLRLDAEPSATRRPCCMPRPP